MIAHNLIDIFETNPEAWNAVRYLNIQGPVSWDQNQDFGTYLHGWYLRTPKDGKHTWRRLQGASDTSQPVNRH